MASVCFSRVRILVRGGGDLATGVACRLFRAGFPVLVTELPTPSLVRRSVSFGEAVYNGQITVEDLTARLVEDVYQADLAIRADQIPVVIDPDGHMIDHYLPTVLVDARMLKFNPDTNLTDAPFVIGLGPGYTTGKDCHVVVETNRGHDLGRVIWAGTAEPDTGEPGVVDGHGQSRVLRAPISGYVKPLAAIGDTLEVGQSIATIGEHTLTAPFKGVLRGLIHERVPVEPGMKIGDLDPRTRRENCFTISDKSLAIGGGVLEAVLSAPQIRPLLLPQNLHEAATSL
jgi:xanthine dehydrogenase accessory factor